MRPKKGNEHNCYQEDKQTYSKKKKKFSFFGSLNGKHHALV